MRAHRPYGKQATGERMGLGCFSLGGSQVEKCKSQNLRGETPLASAPLRAEVEQLQRSYTWL